VITKSDNLLLIIVIIICGTITTVASILIYNYSANDSTSSKIIEDFKEVDRPKSLLLLSTSFTDNYFNDLYMKSFLDASNAFDYEAEIIDNITDTQRCLAEIEKFNAKNGKVVFIPSLTQIDCINVAVVKYPNLKFVSELDKKITKSPNLKSVSTKFYIIQYLTGVIAAKISSSNVFGFVVSNLDSVTIRAINAFAIGIQHIDPHSTVYVAVVDSTKDAAKEKYMAEILYQRNPDIEVMNVMTSTDSVNKFCETNMRKCFGNNSYTVDVYPNSTISTYEADFTVVYKQLLEGIKNGSFVPGIEWYGFNTDTIYLGRVNSRIVPYETLSVVDTIYHYLQNNNKQSVFIGPLWDNENTVRLESGETLDDIGLLNMDWLVKGVEVIYE
jgi:basic membrane lipoprotein Med (substrate-binding protein (PBP1-ABC) superfamily)